MRVACHQVSQPEPFFNPGGADRTRTDDPLHAMQVLYQLSYNPMQTHILYCFTQKVKRFDTTFCDFFLQWDFSTFILANYEINLLISFYNLWSFNMDYQLLKAEVEQKTAQTIEVLKTEYAGLRTGRASVHLLDAIRVPVYGAEMPINQVATVSTPDNQTLSVTVWDITNAPAVEKAIRDSGLGLNPMTAGGVIRLNMPPLTEERRRELTKVAGKYAEEAKISMRNIRQDAMGKIKRAVTDKEISEDDQRKYEDDIQKVFDKRGTEVDALAREKEADIMSV